MKEKKVELKNLSLKFGTSKLYLSLGPGGMSRFIGEGIHCRIGHNLGDFPSIFIDNSKNKLLHFSAWGNFYLLQTELSFQ